jgi:3-deoxy-manno-octulosonate cytidylyltransferase (CMP-KDO synthetase)
MECLGCVEARARMAQAGRLCHQKRKAAKGKAMSITAIIPARLSSSRLPGKVLLARTGKPLIQHVYENALRAKRLAKVVIAADDASVLAACKAFGAPCVLTRPTHPNGTSRLAEASTLLGLGDDAIIANVQGDEPELEPHAIDAACDALLAQSDCAIATVATPFVQGEDAARPEFVKVALDQRSRALLFSRSLLPYPREAELAAKLAAPLRHVGLYVYRAGFLRTYAALAPTPLEQAESLEQLRALEHGYRIAVAVCNVQSGGIDTPAQYEAFVQRQSRRLA